MSIPGAANPLLLASTSTAYTVSRSVRLNSADSAYFSRTPASAGNRKTWTWAGWVKRSGLSGYVFLMSATSNPSVVDDQLAIGPSGNFGLGFYNSGSTGNVSSAALLRDPSAWYHLVCAVDTSQATPANRVKLYINGIEVTAFSASSYPAQDYLSSFNSNNLQTIGNRAAGSFWSDGYLADVYFIDGQALTPSSFTEVSATTGQLIPKRYTGTFTGNSFWLPFSDNSSTTSGSNVGIGKDFSGLGNYWNTTNLSVTAGAGNDSLVDTPTSYGTDTGAGGEVRGNYATLNPTAKTYVLPTFSDGNLQIVGNGSNYCQALGTIAVPTTGKWYFEVTAANNTASGGRFVGLWASTNYNFGLNVPQESTLGALHYYSLDGNIAVNDPYPFVSYGATWTAGDTIGVAVNVDTNTVTFYKNGASQGNVSIPSNMQGVPLYPSLITFSIDATLIANFGQRPFAYTAPSGFKALCDTNLPAPVVAKSASAFDVKLYTGNGSTQTISGLGFSPDLLWFKRRNGINSNTLFDIIRGSTKSLLSDSTAAEATEGGGLSTFNSDGFSLSGDTTVQGSVNGNTKTYVAWCWDAGSSTVTNTQGSITSSVRANTSAGFSAVSWSCLATAGTVGHGLGVAPSLILMKDRNATSAWFVYHKDVGTGKYLQLQSTAATTTNSIVFSTAPTSTVFDPGTAFVTGGGYTATIAYCFAPVAGYSSFGSYTGNGSADGPFVYTGFRPRWVMWKMSSSTSHWWIIDTARSTYNVTNNLLYPNLSDAESTANSPLDVLSNGFKLRINTGDFNTNSATYVWAAFAENPFQYARAR